jgi:hypothetical protein
MSSSLGTREDVEQEACLVALERAGSHDESKGTLAAYVGTIVSRYLGKRENTTPEMGELQVESVAAKEVEETGSV